MTKSRARAFARMFTYAALLSSFITVFEVNQVMLCVFLVCCAAATVFHSIVKDKEQAERGEP